MKFPCKILTLEQQIFSDDISAAMIPTPQGLMEVLAKHEPMVAAVGDGELQLQTGNVEERFAVSSGFVKVLPEKLTIFVEMAERAEKISAQEAETAVRRAEEAMKRGPKKGAEYEQAAIEYRRMVLRLNVARRKRKSI